MPSSKKFSIPAFWHQVLERCGNSTCRCSEQGDPSTYGRRWNSAAHNCSQPSDMANIPCSSKKLDQIHEETRKDPTLKLLMHYISDGWPCEWRQLPQELHVYWNYWEDLSIKDRITTKGSRVLIPSTLQRKALQQIHEGHQGVEKCMLKARESVFWPRISDSIYKAVERCGICQSSSRAAKPIGNVSKVPPHLHGTPWEQICFIGTGSTSLWLVTTLPNSSSSGNFQTVPHMPW